MEFLLDERRELWNAGITLHQPYIRAEERRRPVAESLHQRYTPERLIDLPCDDHPGDRAVAFPVPRRVRHPDNFRRTAGGDTRREQFCSCIIELPERCLRTLQSVVRQASLTLLDQREVVGDPLVVRQVQQIVKRTELRRIVGAPFR